MGDVAMTAPVIAALTQQYPNLKITLLTRGFFKPMFAQLPNVTVYEAEVKGKHKGIFGLWKLYKELRKLNIDAVADFHNVLRSNILKKYFTLSSLPFYQINKGRQEKKALTSLTNKVFKPLKTTHERYTEVLDRLGLSIDLSKVNLLSREPLADNIQTILQADTKKWVGIAPFAAFKGKRYPLHLMEEVVKELSSSGKYKVLLFGGGPIETKQLNALAKEYESVVSLAGEFSFREELTIISNLDLMISMDSGNGHLSVMYGIPTLTIWGVTHPYAGFAPFGQNPNHIILANREQFPLIPTSVYGNKFPDGYENVMESITPEQIVTKVISILD